MYILGINISHHASICLLRDGEIILYFEDDRLSGLKEEEFSKNSLVLSLKEVLNYTNYVDQIILTSFGRNRYFDNPDEIVISNIKLRLEEYGIKYENIFFQSEHHLYHATSCFYSSPFEEAVALIIDGGGVQYNDYTNLSEVESSYYFFGNSYKIIKKHYSSRNIFFKDLPEKHRDNVVFSSSLSCGPLYNTVTHLTGTGLPGNLMGLSAYGNAEHIHSGEWFKYDEISDIWYTDNEEILKCYQNYSVVDDVNPNINDGLTKFDYSTTENIAKKVQEETKLHTIRLINQFTKQCNTNNIVLSGGYFLNCVNNYQYLKEFPNLNFYIDPIAHDGGTAIGAAKYVWHCILNKKERYPLKTLYLSG